MQTVTVSPKYQVVVPRKARESLGIRAGSKLQVIVYQNRIELLPLKKAPEARGLLKAIDTTVEREPGRV